MGNEDNVNNSNIAHAHSSPDPQDEDKYSDSDIWFSQKGLKIAHLNIHYLYPKLDEIKLLISRQKFDILCLCETFLNNSFSDTELSIEHYDIFRLDRECHGGGLLIYVRDNLTCKPRLDLQSKPIESIWLEIHQPNSKGVLLCYCYRPPSSRAEWLEYFTTQLEKSLAEEKENLILGDFNFDLSRPVGSSKSWIDLMHSFNFSQLVTIPTRVSCHSSTLIDHVYTNRPQNINNVRVPNYSISDHYPVCFSYKLSGAYIKGPIHKVVNYRSLKKFDESRFLSDLAMQPWFLIDALDNPDNAIDLFNDLFSKVLNDHAPKRMKRVKRLNQPNWMNHSILDAIKERNYYHKKKDKVNYQICRRKVKHLIYSAKQTYYENTISSMKRDPKKLWNSLHELSGFKNKITTNYIDDENGEPIISPITIANSFNKHFASVHCDLEQIANVHSCDNGEVTNDRHTDTLFQIPHITTSFIDNQLISLDISKSTGSDDLSANFLKLAHNIIAPILCKILNLSIDTSSYPQAFKKAKVIPIHKKGTKCDKNNYRPISILPIISLIFERHVSIHLKDHFESNDLLYGRQSGFRKNHSCETALTKILDDWLTALDQNKIVGTVFLDFSKAFDLVNHTTLLRKLKSFHLHKSTLSWIASYLDKRKQQVQISGVLSDLELIKTGVPQGSVLGPLLFLVYINDFPDALTSTTSDNFADDSTISVCNNSLDCVIDSLNADLSNVKSWCDQNNMIVNTSKTFAMFISSGHKTAHIHDAPSPIHYQTDSIQCLTDHKLLGITMDCKLSWKIQVDIVLKKCNSLLYLLSRIKCFLSIPMRKLFLMHIYCLILIIVVLSGVIVTKHFRIKLYFFRKELQG